jgi:hypothetical protein
MTDSATVTREDAGKEVPVAKLAVASTIGTIIEAYDFVLYGTYKADFIGQPTAERRERFVRKPATERETIGA